MFSMNWLSDTPAGEADAPTPSGLNPGMTWIGRAGAAITAGLTCILRKFCNDTILATNLGTPPATSLLLSDFLPLLQQAYTDTPVKTMVTVDWNKALNDIEFPRLANLTTLERLHKSIGPIIEPFWATGGIDLHRPSYVKTGVCSIPLSLVLLLPKLVTMARLSQLLLEKHVDITALTDSVKVNYAIDRASLFSYVAQDAPLPFTAADLGPYHPGYCGIVESMIVDVLGWTKSLGAHVTCIITKCAEDANASARVLDLPKLVTLRNR